jgi:hypothetical protein
MKYGRAAAVIAACMKPLPPTLSWFATNANPLVRCSSIVDDNYERNWHHPAFSLMRCFCDIKPVCSFFLQAARPDVEPGEKEWTQCGFLAYLLKSEAGPAS